MPRVPFRDPRTLCPRLQRAAKLCEGLDAMCNSACEWDLSGRYRRMVNAHHSSTDS